jgi:predicted Zn-dependent peptidase
VPFLIAAVGVIAGLDRTRADDAAQTSGERRRVLENGLEVVVLPSTRSKAVVVVTTFRAGPRDESKEESGVSQLVARLYRRSAAGARPAGAAEQELVALAASGSQTSGLVGHEVRHDALAFFATAPEEKLLQVLEIERDRIAALAPTDADLEAVRTETVFEAATAEGKTQTRAWNALLALAYGDCGLGRSRLGLPRSVSALSLKTVETWRRARLRPDSAFVLIAGARDSDGALDKAQRALGAMARPKEPAPPRAPTPPAPPGPLRVAIEGPSVARQLLTGFRGPDPGSEDEAAFLALGFELKDRVTAALRGLAHDSTVSADARSETPPLLVVSATPRASVAMPDLEARVTSAVAVLRDEKIQPLVPLVDRVRRELEGLTRPLDGQIANKRDETAALVEAACDRAAVEPLVRRRADLERRLDALTPDRLRDEAHFYLAEDRARVVVVGRPP